jgi:hypothetical protein
MPLLKGEDLRRLFTTFEHTAYRLEVRERYGVGYEIEPVRQFLVGEPVDLTYMQTWLDLMTALARSGKRVERVRVVSQPPSDYTRYGLWLCRYNVDAGEDIRYLDRERASGLPDHDYWLFDSSRLYVLRFDESDDLLGAEFVDDPATVVQHCFWRDAAWHYATPHSTYVQLSGRAVEHPAGA